MVKKPHKNFTTTNPEKQQCGNPFFSQTAGAPKR
jgi:hypothetical protein